MLAVNACTVGNFIVGMFQRLIGEVGSEFMTAVYPWLILFPVLAAYVLMIIYRDKLLNGPKFGSENARSRIVPVVGYALISYVLFGLSFLVLKQP